MPRNPNRKLYKFDKVVADRILYNISVGSYLEVAAAAAGISKVTLLDWLRRGARKQTPELQAFAEGYWVAEQKAEITALGSITKAALAGQWQAAAWRLERKSPERWGRRDHLELGGLEGLPGSFRGAIRNKLETAIEVEEAKGKGEEPAAIEESGTA
jgi:hypothetical protein